MAKLLLSAFLLLLAHGVYAEPRDPNQYFFNEKFGDFKEELQAARKEGKTGVLLMFEQAECPFCYRMETTVLNRPDVQDYYRKHFRIFSVDIKGDTEMVDFKGNKTTEKQFAFENRVRATPVFAFFDLDGHLAVRYTGATRDAAEFLQLGYYVVEGAYKRPGMNFVKYRLQQDAR